MSLNHHIGFKLARKQFKGHFCFHLQQNCGLIKLQNKFDTELPNHAWSRPCQGLGSQLPVSHKGGPSSIPVVDKVALGQVFLLKL